ncbi:TPR-like protein [Imleria badia]|nr:TPR-like protein [Imleria badia]
MKRESSEDKPSPSLGISDFKRWMRESSVADSTLVSIPDPSTSSSDNHHRLVHNALVHVRSKDWSSAYAIARKSIETQPSAMGYIAKAVAQIRMSEPEKAVQIFDFAFANCNPHESDLILLIKTIVLFVARKCDTAISRVRDLIADSRENETKYCCFQVLGKMYLMQEDYARAVQSLEEGQRLASACIGSDLATISLIFGFEWNFDGLLIKVQRRHFEDLYISGRAEEAKEALLKILDTFGEDIRASNWVTDLKRKCIDQLEKLGDTGLSAKEYDNAIAHYTSALSLNPSNPTDILVQRSKAQALNGSWKDALADANEAIEQSNERGLSAHPGYERKYAALHGLENYGEAINALLGLLSIIEKSPDEKIRRLRANYTAPSETTTEIISVIPEISRLCPRILIHVEEGDGRLCDEHERIEMFKSGTLFKKIISETAMTKIDHAQIRQSVAKYFKWIMFSHTWEGREPTFKDVNLVHSVWELDESPLNEKLRQFCRTAREAGHRWAWSDTCCIDKETSTTLDQSLVSMYRWYEKAAETLIYLADVLPSAEPDDFALTNSRWMTRAWTLQELLASKVIRFYNRDWKLYLNDAHVNHKDSPTIRDELAKAMGVAAETIISFQPEDLGVREKLRLASRRNAKEVEDIAYSLLGIFSSDIKPHYGVGKRALGQLLENIVDRTGDLTVIAWIGKSMPYNSALPDSLLVYSQVPYSPPSMEDKLDTRVAEPRPQFAPQDGISFRCKIIQLPQITFSNRRLKLPCIMFTVQKIDEIRPGEKLYRATVSSLGEVEFRTADVMPMTQPWRLVFAHPWITDLREPPGGPMSEYDPQVDTSVLAFRLISRLGRPFNALLFQLQLDKLSYRKYKRVAAEHEIIVPGVPHKTDYNNINVDVLEVV